MPDGSDSARDRTATSDGDAEPAPPTTDADGRREIEVPLRLYKTVTVFSTLIAIGCVVGGFLLLDAATQTGSTLRRLVAELLGAVGLAPAEQVLSGAFALLGLVAIAVGAATYVLGTRFRAPGMTGEEADDDGPADDPRPDDES